MQNKRRNMKPQGEYKVFTVTVDTNKCLYFLVGGVLAILLLLFPAYSFAASTEDECIKYMLVGKTVGGEFVLSETKPGNCNQEHNAPVEDVVQNSLYLTLSDGVEAIEIGNALVNGEVATSFSQPFAGIDIPETIRIYFDEDDWTLELITYYIKWKISDVTIDHVPLFDVNALANDEHRSKQWYLDYIGFNGAHNYCAPPQKRISVAVIDNGFDVEHPDLKDAITQQIDAAHNDGDAMVEGWGPGFNHGTMAAGLVAATTDNDIGIASSSSNSVDLVVVKASSREARATDIDHGLEAFAKAIEADVDMMSVSWGAYGADFPIFRKIINKALDQGIIIVASAGNYTSDEPFFPAAFEGVLSVGSVDKQGRKSWFTNYGPWVDLAAPGEDILATDLGGAYVNSEGTSQATPIAAGAIAFGLSRGLTLEEILSQMEPLVDTDIGDGIISMRQFCTCKVSYPQLDYNSDGVLDDKDLNYIRGQYLGDVVLEECDGRRYGSVCCPPGSFCDLDINGEVNQQDAIYWLWVRLGYIDFDICGDGLDNDCDGAIDDPNICGN